MVVEVLEGTSVFPEIVALALRLAASETEANPKIRNAKMLPRRMIGICFDIIILLMWL